MRPCARSEFLVHFGAAALQPWPFSVSFDIAINAGCGFAAIANYTRLLGDSYTRATVTANGSLFRGVVDSWARCTERYLDHDRTAGGPCRLRRPTGDRWRALLGHLVLGREPGARSPSVASDTCSEPSSAFVQERAPPLPTAPARTCGSLRGTKTTTFRMLSILGALRRLPAAVGHVFTFA